MANDNQYDTRRVIDAYDTLERALSDVRRDATRRGDDATSDHVDSIVSDLRAAYEGICAVNRVSDRV